MVIATLMNALISWMRYRFLNTSSGSRNFQKRPLLKSKGTTVFSGRWKGASTVLQKRTYCEHGTNRVQCLPEKLIQPPVCPPRESPP